MNNDFDQLSILVVDDERDIRDASERILTRMGFHVLKAKRGDEAVDLLPTEKISMVLLDLKMPGMDGMEVLKHVRAHDPEILVIIITGYATVDTAIEAMKRGAYDFIPKPFEPDHLRAVINRAREKLILTREAQKLEAQRRRTLADLDTEKSRVRTIIESLPDGVVVTNADGQVVLMNPAFQWHMGLEPEMGLGLPIETYVSDDALCALIREISSGRHVDYDDLPTIEFSPFSDKYLLAKGQPIIGEKMECLGAVVNIVDITAMKTLDRLKSEFVAKVSHELRSPLSTIHEQLAFVLKDLLNERSDQDLHMLSRAKEKTRGLISLIGDLLDLSRIEAGAVCEEPKPTHIEKLVASIVDFLAPRAKARSQVLTLEVPNGSLPTITADPLALESIFGNLITNAINYTQEGGEIKVIVDHTGINLRIKVKDNGFGIDEKYQDKIFERFFRVKNEKTRYITGTGLGLPIVKGLVDSLNGLISVESVPGKGSEFTVLLPTAEATEMK